MTRTAGRGRAAAIRLPAAVAALLGGLLLGGCVTEVRREPVVRRPDEQPAVSLTMRSDRATYAPGAPIELVLEMVNRGRVPVSLLAPTSQLYEFVAHREETEVWRWSAGRRFTQEVTEVVLGPGQTGVYRVLWDGRDQAGQPLAPGAYVVTGVWVGGQQIGLRPLRLPLTVR